MRPLRLFSIVAASLALAAAALAGPAGDRPYRYLSAAELEQRLKAGEPSIVLDIQVEEEYAKHHITGARPTHAFPVKSPADKAKLDAAVADLAASPAPVVIVCPRGAGGAERTYDHLKARGIPEARLYILAQGQAGWACAELTQGR
ncbi:MAG: rhodanese-like domain-containing protein [Deferrisomatales bacterium]